MRNAHKLIKPIPKILHSTVGRLRCATQNHEITPIHPRTVTRRFGEVAGYGACALEKPHAMPRRA